MRLSFHLRNAYLADQYVISFLFTLVDMNLTPHGRDTAC